MTTENNHQESTFSIPKMDCPSEENLIRMALSSIDNIESLHFDLSRRELKARHQGEPNRLLERLQPLNLGTILLDTQPLSVNVEAGLLVSVFSVPKMDCASEENLIRMAVQDVPGVQSLSFDLSNRVVKATHNGSPNELLQKLESLKLGAILRESKQATSSPASTAAIDDAAQARTLRLLLGINAFMFVIELTTGLIAQSTGLIADSLDMFADAAVYGLALYAVGRAASMKSRAAHLAGWLQLLLAVGALTEVARRFVYGSEPESILMIGMGVIALIANVSCLLLISGKREDGVHMKASYIFSANDVVANLGVIVAGALVMFTASPYPDLVIGTIIGVIVLNGARRILQLK
ncbi:MAG: cation transporter [Nitrosomonas sp.]|jgi:cation transport ATPase|nr:MULTISPECIES: cation transporter [Betaproteobacteria]MDZ4105897.1 cation transporter [Nitrosomonas sp.]